MKNEAENKDGLIENIPIKRNIHIKLTKTEPSGYPVTLLKDQMTKLGLTCEETSLSQLKQYKEEILRNFPHGTWQAYYISKGKMNTAPNIEKILSESNGMLNEVQVLEQLGFYSHSINGSWIIDDDAGGYRDKLCRIIYEKNFDKLLSEHPGTFTGKKESQKKVINEPTGRVIRDTFDIIAKSICATVVGGIAPEDLESIISGIIGNNTSEKPADYELDNVLNVYLVNGYDSKTHTAISIGVLAISYKIHIKNYKDKSDHKGGRHNDAEISVTARFVSYSDVADMDRDIGYLDQQSLRYYLENEIPIPDKKIVVYTEKPAANKTTFNTGLPIVAPGAHADSMIFFCPNLENVGYIDNTASDVTTTYSRSVTVGFSHSSEFTISSEVSMELDCEIAKSGVKMGVNMSMTEEWNKSQEETISYEVGAGKEAYLYQGKLKCIVLRYDPAKNSYQYLENSLNTFSSTSVKTTKTPIKSK